MDMLHKCMEYIELAAEGENHGFHSAAREGRNQRRLTTDYTDCTDEFVEVGREKGILSKLKK